MRLSVSAAVLLSAAAAYYVYLPLPPGVCEPWKLMLLDALFRSFMSAGELLHGLGVLHRVHLLNRLVSLVEEVPPRSSPALLVTDSALSGVPARVFRPRGGGRSRGACSTSTEAAGLWAVHVRLTRARSYTDTVHTSQGRHAGGFCVCVYGGMFSSYRGMRSYDLLCRKMAEDLDAVILSVDYGLAPESVFPAQYVDALSASRSFLSSETWSRFGLDPDRLCISGDSAGANLAAAVTQTLCSDPSLRSCPRLQALVYPVLQALDFQTSSYQQNRAVPILYPPVMARFWLQYLDADPLLEPSMLQNQHSAALDPDTRAKINWTALLPAHVRKHYLPVGVAGGGDSGAGLAPVFLDVRAAPLLADEAVLSRTPRAYILTCEFDVLRDDGLMYARRLLDAGVTVTSDHYHDGFHGCMVFAHLPMMSSVGRRSLDGFIRWLDQNL